MPIGKPVLVILSSKDVVHSFGLPQMRVKQDAVPGIVQPVWFTPTLAGRVEHRLLAAVRTGPRADARPVQGDERRRTIDAWIDEEALYIGL